MGPAEGMEALIRSAAELTSKETPLWEFAAARLRYCGFACEVEEQLKGLGIKGLYEKNFISDGAGVNMVIIS